VKAMPWYVALSASIILILVGIYKKINIGLTMLLGALVLGILIKLPLSALIRILFEGLTNRITVMLTLSIILLGILGNILKETGALRELVENLQQLVSDFRIISAAMPALIGMLTVPGGAILSAPLCAETGNKLDLPPHRQAAVNIWFRHVLYFMLPLFPSLILTSQLSGVPISRLVLYNLPLTIIGIMSGFHFLFRGYPGGNKGYHFSTIKFLSLLRSILPLIMIMLLVVFCNLYFPLAIAAGTFLALINYLPKNNIVPVITNRLKNMILPGLKLPIAFVIIGIMIYKEMLEETAVLVDMTNLVLGFGIPVLLLIVFIPFIIGMLTGDNSASVAVIFPMFIPLLPTTSPTAYTAYIAYLYVSSTAGHIISLAHPCFSLTKEYFQEEIKGIVLSLLPLLLIVMITGLLLTLAISHL
jgi:uncharacterized protein